MRTSTLRQLLGIFALSLALAVAGAAGFGSSQAQAQVDCERVEYNDQIVVRCDTSGVDTDGDGSGSGTSTDNQGDGDRDPDGDGDSTGADADGENDTDGDSTGADDGVDADGAEDPDAEDSDDQVLFIETFVEDEDAVAVNGVFEFDEGDRGGRRGVDDRRERAIAAAEAQAQAEADLEAAQDAEAAADQAQAEAAAEEAAQQAAQDAADAAADPAGASEDAEAPGGEGDDTSEVASGASTGGIDDSGGGLWWLILALGLLALAFVGVLLARRRGEAYYDEDEESWDEGAPVTRASTPGPDQGPPEGWGPPVAGSGIAAAPPADVPGVNAPHAEVSVEHLPAEQVTVAETRPTPGPLANLFPPLSADADAPVEYAGGTEVPDVEVPMAEVPGAEVERASTMPPDAAMIETVRLDPTPVERDSMTMPPDAEVAQIEVPIETAPRETALPTTAPPHNAPLEDLPPPPSAPGASQPELPVRQARNLPSRQARDLPTRDPGSQLSTGAAAAAAAAEGSNEFHRLPDSLSTTPTVDPGPEPALPHIDVDEITQERPGD